MRKKNLKIQVAALAVTGAIATTPFVARAEETSSTAATGTEATATTTATAAGTTTVGTTTAAAETPAASTTTAPASTAPAASTAATTAATTTTSGTTATTPAASGVATTPAAGTTTPAAPVTVTEPAADPATTAPNNVENVVKDDKQGTDIHFKADGEIKKTVPIFGEITIPVHKDYNAEIKPEDTKDDKKLKDTVQEFKYTDLGKLKNNDLVMHGDLSIQKDGDTTPFDSTSDKAKDVEKTDTYTLKAELDVSPVHNTLNAMNSLVGNFTSNGLV